MSVRGYRKQTRGFTLIESTLAICLVGILFVTAVAIFVGVSQEAVKTQAQVFSSADASIATQKINSTVREAAYIAIPSDSAGFTPPAGYTASSFETTYNGATVCSCLYLQMPVTNPVSITFPGCSNAVSVYERSSTPTQGIWFYRGTSSGAPDPGGSIASASKGSDYLWELSSDGTIDQPIVKSIAGAPNAVQFQRPTVSLASTEVEIKVVSGYYSPINNTQTNEYTNGHYTSSLTGTCVRMRDAYTGVTALSQQYNTGTAHWSSD